MGRSLEIVFRYRPNRRPDINALVGTIRRVFADNGIDIDFHAGADASLAARGMESVRVSDCVMAIGDHRGLFDALTPRLQSPNQIVIFVVRDIVDAGVLSGCAACPSGCPGAIITEDAAAGIGGTARDGLWVLAHEVGHLLGLDHVPTTSALMFDPATSISVMTPVLTLTDRQTVLASPLLGSSTVQRNDVVLSGLRGSVGGQAPTGSIDARTTPAASIDARDTPIFAPRHRSLLDQLGA